MSISPKMGTKIMKVYLFDDCSLYAAESMELAVTLYKECVDKELAEGCPRELTESELNARYPKFDENENPVEGQTISILEMLAEHGDEPGLLAGGVW